MNDRPLRGQSREDFTVLEPVLENARHSQAQRLCLAAPNDDADTMVAIKETMELGLITEPIFVGDSDLTHCTMEKVGIDESDVQVLDRPQPDQAAQKAAHLVGSGEADILCKGRVPTAQILKAVLNPKNNLRMSKDDEESRRLISHLCLFDIEGVNRVIGVSDAGLNIAPKLDAKYDIVKNAAEAFQLLLGQTPKVAVLAAVEKVNEDMPATVEAKYIEEAARRGQLGDVLVQGPLSLDCAVDRRASEGKGVDGPVAGQADVIITPNIEAGNMVVKSMMYFAQGIMAGILVGTRAPVIVNSRVDVPASRIASILTAVVLSQQSA